MRVCVYVRARMCVCVCTRGRARVCVCVREKERERERTWLLKPLHGPCVQKDLKKQPWLASLVSKKSTETDSSVIKVLVDCP